MRGQGSDDGRRPPLSECSNDALRRRRSQCGGNVWGKVQPRLHLLRHLHQVLASPSEFELDRAREPTLATFRKDVHLAEGPDAPSHGGRRRSPDIRRNVMSEIGFSSDMAVSSWTFSGTESKDNAVDPARTPIPPLFDGE